jgi:hypothetical protein
MTSENQCSCSCTAANEVKNVSADWTAKDWLGTVAVRFSNHIRMRYKITPGLYSIGAVDKDSPVFVSANYKLSFDILRKSLRGINAYILVLDTRGINVWCAAGKGTFGTAEIVNRIKSTGLDEKVLHRTIIVPQLGAPGIRSNQVLKESGFRVVFGPVRAEDLPEFIERNYDATKEMRTVRFGIIDRMTLIPIEVKPALKLSLPIVIILGLILGLNGHGFSFEKLMELWSPVLLAFGSAVFAGAILTPVFLPVFPFRSFCVKGLICGFLLCLPFMFNENLNLFARLCFLFIIPALSSYLAFNFTGSTTFTNPSGVKKELKIAFPFYIISSVISAVFFIFYRIQTWSV